MWVLGLSVSRLDEDGSNIAIETSRQRSRFGSTRGMVMVQPKLPRIPGTAALRTGHCNDPVTAAKC